ncbi:transporter substrate-binding domain-containing protein [Rhizobium nepotum]|uniref:transporter substrate-binding domain-containing protein n=1 Tax=Rhizobium nepotum TaxID=1035271 RepID=UPI003CE76738
MKLKSLLVAAVAFAGLAINSIANAADLELLESGKLMVATEGTYAPFSMRAPDGKLDGLEIRVMQEVAKRLNLEYTPVLIKWDSLLVGLQADQYDVISAAMDITEARQKQVTFSNGWLESGGRVVTAKDSKIASAADIKGQTVGALVASSWTKIAEDKGATVKGYKAESDAMQDLVNGNVDAVITDFDRGCLCHQVGQHATQDDRRLCQPRAEGFRLQDGQAEPRRSGQQGARGHECRRHLCQTHQHSRRL